MSKAFVEMVKEAKKKKEDDKSYRSPYARFLQGGAGLGMMKGNLPAMMAQAKGRANLWHATPAKNMLPGAHGPGIIQEGLTTAHAGANKRLNSHLITNAISRDTEEFLKQKGVKITPEVEEKLFSLSQNYEATLENHKNMSEAVLANSDTVAHTFNVNPQELRQHYEAKLPEMGKRLYFGNSPEGVAFWGKEGKTERHHMVDAFKLLTGDKTAPSAMDQLKTNGKIFGESLLEQGSGGYFGDLRAKFRYGSPQETINIKNLSELGPHIPTAPGHNVLFRSSVPTGTIDAYKDLPVARHMISSSPGLKSMVGRFLPQNDPAKDMSITEGVSPKNINQVHIVDDATGKIVKRINIQESEKAPLKFLGGSGNRLRNIRRMAIPGAISAIGAGMAYNAITGKDAIDQTKNFFSKTSAVQKRMLAKTFAYPAGVVGAAGLAAMGVRRGMGIELPKGITQEQGEKMSGTDLMRFQANELAYNNKMAPINAAISGIGGAGLGALALKKSRPIGAMAGGLLGSSLGAGMGGGLARHAANLKADPKHSGILGLAARNDTARDFIKEHPEEVALGTSAVSLGATAAAPYIMAKHYYPYHTKKYISPALKKVSDKFSKLSPEKSKALAKWAIPGTAAAIAYPVLTTYLQSSMLEGALRAGALGTDTAMGRKAKPTKKKKEGPSTTELALAGTLGAGAGGLGGYVGNKKWLAMKMLKGLRSSTSVTEYANYLERLRKNQNLRKALAIGGGAVLGGGLLAGTRYLAKEDQGSLE